MKKQIIALGLCLTLLACQYKMKDPLYDQLKLKNYIENCNHDIPEKLIPDDKFIFLEISIVESAKFIPRNPRISEIPCRNIDFPIYSYNDSLKEIKSWAKSFKPDFNRLKLVLGKEYWLTGIRGSGGGTDLYAFEYLTAYSGETAVYCIDSLGTIHLRHENIYYKVDY